MRTMLYNMSAFCIRWVASNVKFLVESELSRVGPTISRDRATRERLLDDSVMQRSLCLGGDGVDRGRMGISRSRRRTTGDLRSWMGIKNSERRNDRRRQSGHGSTF